MITRSFDPGSGPTQDTKIPQSGGNRKLQRQICRVFGILLASFAFAWPMDANPALPHVFSDHMVLQRDAAIPFWGSADPGEKITVSLEGHSAETVADEKGHWEVSLPPLPAGGPFSVRIGGKTSITLRDVMVGEVWVASGQSNMTYALSGATGADEEISRSSNPEIRFFTVPQRISLTPKEDTLEAAWEPCTPDTAKKFSAVAYFFAKDLQENLHLPVGIILSAWPGTAGEEWTDPDSLRNVPALRSIVDRWEASPEGVKNYAAHPIEFSMEYDDFELLPAEGNGSPIKMLSNFDSGEADTTTGGLWSYTWQDGPETDFELSRPGRGGEGFAARIQGKLDGANASRLEASFARSGSTVDLSAYAGICFWMRGNGSVQFQMLQPTITDWDNYASPTFHGTSEWKETTVWFRELKQAGWGVSEPLTPKALSGFLLVNMTREGDPERPPSGLYEAMIAPLEKYRIRGAIWYQGESNTWHAHQYQELLPALIRGWRKGWNEGDFPFLIVQLPNQGRSPELGDSIWAELREAQLMTVKKVPNTGLAVTIDVGEENNLHPPNKAPVGERLALWALGTTYGKKIVYSGPLYQSTEVEGNQVRIHFSHIGSGLEIKGGNELKGFAIAGADRKFHWAQAQISGDTVVVSSAEVPIPVAVRYAWAGSPECNLYNKEDLPASPFRTDDWPGASDKSQ